MTTGQRCRAHRRRCAGLVLASVLALGSALTAGCTSPSSKVPEKHSTQSGTAVPKDIQTVPDIAAMVPERIRNENTLRVGSTLGYSPAAYKDSSTGKLAGYEIDMARSIAAVMGLESTTIVPVEFREILSGLAKQYDVAIAGLTVSQGRLEEANFVTYAEVGSLYAVTPNKAKNFDAEAPCGNTIGVVAGSLQYDYLEIVSGHCTDDELKPITIVTDDSQDHLFTVLQEGKLDAVLGDMGTIQHGVTASNGKVKTVGAVISPDFQGIAISKVDSQLTVATQAAVQYLMDNGYLDEVFSQYLASDIVLKRSEINPKVD